MANCESLKKYKLQSAATTNASLVKPGDTTLYHLVATNTNAAVRYLKLYDKATAPTVGTDSPEMTIALPATSTVSIPFAEGQRFLLGLGLATTVGIADSDVAAVGANDVKARLSYE